ncbi:hypothetical protein [Stakelama saccharophila]|uniref:Serine aminopeptidase S33 domain-containing protein n=1 Tax=Stakelama saccharophila TaxID=3075605 RepID=A0ABZ0B7M8_9SPHN|nr:hypothetical protein [Stakelama sp. W311]WNO53005.1 hypothetical protein RPR59_11135 [Stakelama sp. W311]
MRCRTWLQALLPIALAGCMHVQAPPAPPVTDLYARSFGEQDPSDVRTLAFVLNGDDGAAVGYQAAQAISDAVPDSLAVALLRPGFSDDVGNASPGDRGIGNGDRITRDRMDRVAQAISAYKRRYPTARTVLIGSGGGAAIAADLAGTRPDLVDGMALVSCPCTLPEWRRYMAQREPEGRWNAPVDSLDPLQTAGGVSTRLRAAIIVGADDERTPSRFSRPYAEALALRGIATDFRILPGKATVTLEDPEVVTAVTRLAAALPEKTP